MAIEQDDGGQPLPNVHSKQRKLPTKKEKQDISIMEVRFSCCRASQNH